MVTRADNETLYQRQVRTGILSSQLPVQELPDPGVIRAPRGANPVNADNKGATKRLTMPLSPQANPRIMNPAINTSPWATSYAQSRSQPKSATMKSAKNRRKRQARSAQQHRQRRTGGGV